MHQICKRYAQKMQTVKGRRVKGVYCQITQTSVSSGCWLGNKQRQIHWRSTKETEVQENVERSTGVSKAWSVDHLELKWSSGQSYIGRWLGKWATGVTHCQSRHTLKYARCIQRLQRHRGKKLREKTKNSKNKNTNQAQKQISWQQLI